MAVGSSSGPPPAIAAGSVPAGAASHAQNIGEVVVEHVPDRLAQLPRTIILTGMISAQKDGGALVLKTQVGELTIRSPIALPTDKILAIQIPPGAPPVRATISIMSVGPASLVEAPPTVQVAQPAILPNQPAPSAAPTGFGSLNNANNTSAAALTPSRTAAALSAQMALLPLLEGSVVEAKIHALPVPGVMPSPLLTSGTTPPAGASATAPLPLLTSFFKGGSAASPPPTLPASPPPSLLGLLSGKAPSSPAPSPAPSPTTPPISQQPSSATPSLPLTPAAPTLPTPVSTAPSTLAAFGAKALETLTPSTLGPLVSGLSDTGALRSSPTPAPMVSMSGATTSALPPSSFATAFMSPKAMAEPAFQSFPSLLALPPGSVATFQVDTITLPQPAAQPAQAQAVATATPAPSSAPAQQSPTTAATSAAPAAAQPSDTAFLAIVVGRAPQGQALATSPLGLLVLDTKADLPVGTRVTLSVLHIDEPPALHDDAPSTPATPKDWPALQSLVSVLPPDARPFVHMARPQTFGASVLFMLTALRFGDIRALIKDDVLSNAQDSGAGDLISRVMGELSQATQNWQRPEAMADPAAWRSLALPLWSDGGASRLALHVRREPDPESDGSETRAWGQRLVVEVNLSRLGPLLLDGFILAKRFALTLRSQRKLPTSLQAEIQSAFDASLSASGWSGRLSFETAADIWLGKRQR